MKRISTHSIRSRLTIFSLILLLSVSALLFYNNYSAIRMIHEKVYNTMQSTIIMYQNQLNYSLNSAETYLANYAYDAGDIQSIEANNSSSSKWFSAVYSIQKSFDNSIPIYSVDSFFLYSLPGKDYIANTQPSSQSKAFNRIKSTICLQMDDGTLITKKNAGKWFPLLIGDKYYLFRVIKVHNSYVGAWVSAEHALEPLIGGEITNSNIFFISDNGVVLRDNAAMPIIPTPKNSDSNSFTEVQGNNLMVSQKTEFGDLYLASLVSEEQLSAGIDSYMPVIFLVLVSMLIIIFFVIITIRQWIIQPITKLTTAIHALRNGDLDVSVKNAHYCDEFREVNTSFNEMVHEVKSLKIDVYEERLNKQQVQMQYLKLQIAPHFLINCLNTIYQLTETNHPELTREMAKDLSCHLRYTLSSGKTVSLEQETVHVANYVALSQIRYPNCITLETDYVPETLSATAIPLLILNFVENTVKYEAVIGKSLIIHISTYMLNVDGKPYIGITIWDNGSGFSQDILSSIQNIPQYIEDNHDQHIGISNVFQRADIVFGDCDFLFCNREGAGAQIDIKIPYVPFEHSGGTL